MARLFASHLAVLRALVECADGAATFPWLMAYTGLTHDTVSRACYQLARQGLAAWVGHRRTGSRPLEVYAATPRGRDRVAQRMELAA